MLEIRVIGELNVRLNGRKGELPPSRRVRALLGWLALHPGRHSRSRLAGLFWPDVPETSARASLRSAIWALRAAVGPDFGGYLGTDRDTVTLAGGDLQVDLREFRRLAGLGQPAAALALCHGDLLQELDDDWVVAAREELEDDIAAALHDVMTQASQAGDHTTALGCARRRVVLRPLDEAAGGDLIQLLIRTGDSAAALETFAQLEQRLAAELHIPVSAETTALVAPIRRAPRPPGQDEPPADPPEPPGPSRSASPGARLIGREADVARLTRAWLTARSGNGTAVLLEGEGGIGKTRLVEELQATVRTDRSGSAVRGLSAIAAAGPGQAAPFALWTDVLSELAAVTGLPPADEPWTAALARIVPAAAYGAAPHDDARRAADPQLERARLCEAVVQFLAWVSQRSALLLALEDLHLADTASLELIAYAGRRLSRLPVLFVLTRRRMPARQDLDAVLAALRARGALATEIRVGPLADDATRALVEDTASLPEPVVRHIIRLAAGSPLLAVETARAAASDPADPGFLSGLSGAVRIATSRLSGPARMFAEFTAVAGRSLDPAEVAALPLPNPARAAAEALGSGLLRTDDGRTGFRHALLADALYQDIPDGPLVQLHGALAQMLRKRAQQTRAGHRRQRAAEIARHFKCAGQDEQAVGYLVTAAHDARSVAAMAEADRFLTEAVEIDPDDPEILVELAEVRAFRGLLNGSDQAFDRALELIAPQDSGALISAWLRRGRWLRGGVCHPRESRRAYRIALDVLDRDPGADQPARAEALAGLAWAEAVAGDPGAVEELLAETDRILGGGRPGDLLTHDIGVARGHALIRAGQFTESFGPLIAASAAAGRAGRPDMASGCLSNAASAAACAGDFERALDFADRCLPLVVPNGLLRLSVYAQTARSAILRRLERLPEARQACDVAAGYADRAGQPPLEGLVRQERGLIALAASDPAMAMTELSAALDLGAPVSRAATRLRLAEAYTAGGQPDRAEAELREVTLEPVGPSDFPATLVAHMSRVQGLIAAARGDPALAERRLDESLAAWQRLAGVPDRQQAGAGYVASLIDLGRPPISSLAEPARELAIVQADLSALRGRAARTATATGAPHAPEG
jgi:DNA-binding SARP family transcriptional activator/tetratricopeptide (TPR) repeat protein